MIRRCLLSMLVLILLASPGFAAETPLSRTQALMHTFESVQHGKPGAQLSDAAKKANRDVYKQLDAAFDRDALTAEAVAPYKSQFTAAQLVKYSQLFWELIRLVAYPDALRGATWSAKAGTQQGDSADVIVHARKEAEDVETDVTFHWRRGKDGWLVHDVSFDGASLVADYRNQFGKILNKDGVAGLLRKLQTRYDEERKKRGEDGL